MPSISTLVGLLRDKSALIKLFVLVFVFFHNKFLKMGCICTP
ncbi:hypothetical protein [Moraxella phage Mcat18]|nr:hypothetical protein [Moraxella phage Mcat18]AKI27808.1 hypothetical protein [Moraxella phage Mcat19]